MYYYAYAAFTNEDENLKLLGDIKAAINQSEITGVESTLSELRTMRDLVNDAKLQKATTFVVVGDDGTFHEALRVLIENNGMPIGFIPFMPSIIADILGVPDDPVQAARVLARRRTVRVPLGMANKRPFFSALTLKKPIPANGRGGRMCHNFTPAMMSNKKANRDVKAAVPKSSTIIRKTTRPTIMQIGTNLFQNSLILSPNFSHTAAKKKTTAHFASSEG